MLSAAFSWPLTLHSAPRCFLRAFLRSAVAALILLATASGGQVSAQGVGPSFPCAPAPTDALARLTCADSALYRADLQLVQTYYALRQSVEVEHQKPLRSEFLSFIVRTRQNCGLPPVEPNRDQSQFPVPSTAAQCVIAAYDTQRGLWAGRLSGPAAEEAARAAEQNVALQAKLKSLAYLPADAGIDGVFGTATRTAILAWQHATGRPETGFFSNADEVVLLANNATSPPDQFAGYRSKTLAQADYKGKPVVLDYRNLHVAVDTQQDDGATLCHPPEALSLPVSYTRAEAKTCVAVVAKISVDGTQALAVPLGVSDDPADISRMMIRVAIWHLDPATTLPQVVMSGYTGGAHCCTSTVTATSSENGQWQTVDLGSIDGDDGFALLDPARDGTIALVDYAPEFDYHFASHAGSFAPTRIQIFRAGKLRGVSGDPRYRGFQLARLREMERFRSQQGEVNGFLAGWVAQKALVGQLDDAWRVMLASYDRKATEGLSDCFVNKRVWTKTSYGVECPPGEERHVLFPEALAHFHVEHGYLTAEQSAALGFDEARRRSLIEMRTSAYEQAILQGWFFISRTGDCALARSPDSPAAFIKGDRTRGVEDSANVLQSDADGKPLSVRVDSPRANGLVSTLTFYRGLSLCTAVRQKEQQDLEKLK
jgi:hypothetical protein